MPWHTCGWFFMVGYIKHYHIVEEKKNECADFNTYWRSWSLSSAVCWRMFCKARLCSGHLPVLTPGVMHSFHLDDRCCVSFTQLMLCYSPPPPPPHCRLKVPRERSKKYVDIIGMSGTQLWVTLSNRGGEWETIIKLLWIPKFLLCHQIWRCWCIDLWSRCSAALTQRLNGLFNM